MDLALFTKKYRTSGIDGARFSSLRKRRNLMPVTNSTCGTMKPSLNVPSTKRAPYSSVNLPTCFWRTSGFILIQPGGPAQVLERCEDILLPSHTSVPRNWANTNETEQTTPNSKTITANRRTKTKTDNENSSNGATNITLTRFRKEASILRTETFGSHKEENHTLPKGSVNHGQAASGYRTSHWGDLCEELRRYLLYRLGLAGGITTSTDKAHHKSKVNEWLTECVVHIFPSKN